MKTRRFSAARRLRWLPFACGAAASLWLIALYTQMRRPGQSPGKAARHTPNEDERLRAEHRQLVAAIEAARDAIWVSDAAGRVVLVNAALERPTGRRRAELLGQPCRAIIGAHTRAGAPLCAAVCPFAHLPENSGGIETGIPTASGDEIWGEISYGRIAGAGGRVEGTVHVLHDLSQRKAVERMKDEFVAMVSHELRAPLNHIKGFTSTLLQDDVAWDAETQREFLASIEREADRLARLVDQILDMSRIEAGAAVPGRRCSAYDLVDAALRRAQHLTEGRQLRLDLPACLPPLLADQREVELVLTNLLENAAKYSPPGAPIDLAAASRGAEVIFSVTDRGIGIAPEHQDRIFEQFYRVAGARPEATGVGLGLAICKRIVEANGGRIWVESRRGRAVRVQPAG